MKRRSLGLFDHALRTSAVAETNRRRLNSNSGQASGATTVLTVTETHVPPHSRKSRASTTSTTVGSDVTETVVVPTTASRRRKSSNTTAAIDTTTQPKRRRSQRQSQEHTNVESTDTSISALGSENRLSTTSILQSNDSALLSPHENSNDGSFRLSTEQQAFVDTPYIRVPGSRIRVQAGPGSGKSTTIMHFAMQHVTLRILYLVLNASMAEKAKAAMAALTNISVFTFHALAYDRKVRQEGFTLCEDEDAWRRAVNGMMFRHQGRGLSRKELFHVLKGLQLFWQSDDLELTSWHYSHLWPSARAQRPATAMSYLPSSEQCLQWGNQFMRWMRAKELPFTFGMMLKQFHLDNPDLASEYDVCMLDEAQDAFAVVDDTLHPKPRLARDGTLTRAGRNWVIVWVGDRYQQINQFLGGVNAMDRQDFTASYYFPHSRRFGPEIALFRNELFGLIDLTDEPVIGDNARKSHVRPFCFYDHNRNRLAQRHRITVSDDNASVASSNDVETDGDDHDNDDDADSISPREPSSGRRSWLWEEHACRWKEPNDMYRDAFGPRARIVRNKVVGVLAQTNMTLLRILTTTCRTWIASGSIRYVLAKSLQAYVQHILTLLRMSDEELLLEEKQALEERQVDILGKVDYVRRVGPSHIAILELLITNQTASIYEEEDDNGDADSDDMNVTQEDKAPLSYWTTVHSSKGSDFDTVILCRDLEDAMLEALFIPRTQFEALKTDHQVDTFMQKHRANKCRHEYDHPTTFLGGVGITRVEELLCVPEQLYKLYRHFKRRKQSPQPPASLSQRARVSG